MTDKYKLIPSDHTYLSIKLYRIEALKNFDDIKCGDLGGFVNSDSILDQNDDSWIYGDSTVVQTYVSGSKIRSSFISNSSCLNSQISNSTIDNSTIKNSIVNSVNALFSIVTCSNLGPEV